MTIAAQLGQISRSIEMSAKARQFVNLAIAVALSRGNREALQANRRRSQGGQQVVQIG